MIDDDTPFDWAEGMQRDEDGDRLADKAVLISACAGAAVLIVAVGVLVAGRFG